MAGEQLVLDPLADNAANTQLVLVDNATYYLLSHQYPPPPLDAMYAFSSDTEGDIFQQARYKNRVITIVIRVVGTSGANLETLLGALQQKVAKIVREGGVLQRIPPSGNSIFFDLLPGNPDIATAQRYVTRFTTDVTLTFDAKPFGRGAEVNMGWSGSSTVLAESSLVSYWRLGEASGTAAADSKGANTGTYTGGFTLGAAGPFPGDPNKAVTLNGSTGYVTVPDAASLRIAGDITIEAWVNPTDRVNYNVIASKGTTNTAGPYEFRLDQTTGIPTFTAGNGVAATAVSGTTAITSAAWSHVAVTVSGATVTHYLNGVANGSGALGGGARADTGHALQLGRREDGLYFKGSLDDISIYNTALNASQIATHYRAGTGQTALTFRLSGVKGDVPATVRLLVQEGSSQDQWWVITGLQSRYDSTSVDADLFYEAEGRTALNGAAAATGLAGASGAATNNVMRSAALTTSYAGVLSTQATGAGNQLAHIGDFQVIARVNVHTGAGTVTARLSWSVGDFRAWTPNAAVTLLGSGNDRGYYLLDLGQVHLPLVTAGTQQWQGRVEANSTSAGDILDVDCLFVVPITEGSARISAVQQFETPTTLTAADEFAQTAGNLVTKVPRIGAAWAGGGSATDFAVDATNHRATRGAIVDADGAGRAVWVPTNVNGSVLGQVDFCVLVESLVGPRRERQGLVLRVTDINNHLQVLYDATSTDSSASILIRKRIGGTYTTIYSGATTRLPHGLNAPNATIRAEVDAGGRVFVYCGQLGAATLVASAQDAALATGGTLANGYGGFYEESSTGGSGAIIGYDNFFVAPATPDAAIFSGRQLELRSDRANRQDSAGTIWTAPSKYEGDYLKVPAAGRENRSTRVIVKGSRNVPTMSPDTGIDRIQAQAYVTPRYLVVPEG